MLAVPHLIFGAALGQAVSELPGSGAIALGLGVLSHYFLDSIPHWERLVGPKGSEFQTETPLKEWPRSYLIQTVIDVVLAVLLLVYLLWRVPHGDAFWQSPVFWGAIGGLLPDVIDNTPFWNRTIAQWPVFKQQRFFHRYMHISEASQEHMPRYAGLLTQLAVFVLSAWLLLSS